MEVANMVKWHDAGTKMQNKMYLMISSLLPNTLIAQNIRRPTFLPSGQTVVY
jgi:hypothetical protein